MFRARSKYAKQAQKRAFELDLKREKMKADRLKESQIKQQKKSEAK